MNELLKSILDIYRWIIIASAFLSWIPISGSNEFFAQVRALLANLTEPVYAPIRSVIDPMKFGGIDLSPLIVLLLIEVIVSML